LKARRKTGWGDFWGAGGGVFQGVMDRLWYYGEGLSVGFL
jgi:hypothetical protein